MLRLGTKPTEGRHNKLPEPFPGNATPILHIVPKMPYTDQKHVLSSKRHPRTHSLAGYKKIKTNVKLNSRHWLLEKTMPLHMGEKGNPGQNKTFMEETQKYAEATNNNHRPPEGWPGEQTSCIVFYQGELTEEQEQEEKYKQWLRGYTHNWKVKCVLVFGYIITPVRFKDGLGCQSGVVGCSLFFVVGV
jgi:hypothetical protein